jgi:hypothetical protein
MKTPNRDQWILVLQGNNQAISETATAVATVKSRRVVVSNLNSTSTPTRTTLALLVVPWDCFRLFRPALPISWPISFLVIRDTMQYA